MQRVFVIGNNKKTLMPCHPARARHLLRKGLAKIYRKYPFTIILTHRNEGAHQPLECKVDPGSKTTGIALVLEGAKGRRAIWAGHLIHRGSAIRDALTTRRAMRRGRRHRKLRYRMARFDNRRRLQGWLPPSLVSRVDNIANWVNRLLRYVPIQKLFLETVRFDLQQLQQPDIAGIAYQKGTLFGYEVREYVLEKWQRMCAYCDKQHIPLEIDHIHPKSKGGSNRVSNLTLTCRVCNEHKGNQAIKEFLSHDQKRLKKILNQVTKPLHDAASVNATRFAVGERLKKYNLPIHFSSGGRTKFNRIQQGYAKEHFIDAACVGESGERVYIPLTLTPLQIEACGRGTRQMCRVNKYGFPRTKAKAKKQMYGFKTGDLVQSKVTKGKKTGNYVGRLAVRASGNFNIKTTTGVIEGINYKYCRTFHRADGYNYIHGGGVSSPI